MATSDERGKVVNTLRDFLEYYEKLFPDDVVTIKTPVSLEYETTAYYNALKERNPVIRFTNIKGYPDFDLVTNILGSYRRMAFALRCNETELEGKWTELMRGDTEPDVIRKRRGYTLIQDNQVNLFALPVPKHYKQDGSKTGYGHYITSGLAITRNPDDSSVINLSFNRIQLIGETKYAFDAGSHGHMWKYLQKCRKKGERMQVTVVIGAHPLFYMLAASFIENEYRKACSFLKSSLVEGWLNDIPLPTGFEIALEAEVLLDESFDEGPFSEYTGYMGRDSTRNVAHVKSIILKKSPIYYDIQPSNSSEHVSLFSFPRNVAITTTISEFLPQGPVYRIIWPPSASHYLSLCYITDPEPGLAKQLGLAVLGLDPLFAKLCFVNQGAVDLTLENVLVNLARNGLKENPLIVDNVYCIKSNPTVDRNGTSSKIIIVTEGDNPEYTKTVEPDMVTLRTRYAKVVFSRKRVTGAKVNVILGKDVSLENTDEVAWSIATRVRPDKDIHLTQEGLVFEADKRVGEVPVIPPSVKRRIASIVTPRKPRWPQ
jgi:2,5-furandicarboxylate decarboxylase 1